MSTPAAKPKKEQLKFEGVAPRVEVGGTFDVKIIGPAGSTENVTLKIAPGSQVSFIKICLIRWPNAGPVLAPCTLPACQLVIRQWRC